jgi:hypothetical protein
MLIRIGGLKLDGWWVGIAAGGWFLSPINRDFRFAPTGLSGLGVDV